MALPYGHGSYPPTSPIPTAFRSRPQHAWPALLTLFFLAPIIPEMLTMSFWASSNFQHSLAYNSNKGYGYHLWLVQIMSTYLPKGRNA